jgi:hypothetical protein
MTFWEKVNNQNKKDSSLITELSDLSYKSIRGKRQEPRVLIKSRDMKIFFMKKDYDLAWRY